MKKFIGFVIAVSMVLLGTVFALHMMIDQQKIRQHVVQSLREQTGLELQMERAEFEILPWPSFHAQSITVMRPHCTAFLTAHSVHADISLLKLFRREFSFQDFTAEGAFLSFRKPEETVASSQEDCSSWFPTSFKTGAKIIFKKDAVHKKWHVGEAVEARWKISFDALHLSNSRIFWQNEGISSSDDNMLNKMLRGGALDIESLDLAGLRTQNPWINLSGLYNGQKIEIKGHIGHLSRLFRLSHQHEKPWYFSLGVIWGAEEQKGNLMLDGSFEEPALLEGGRFSLQGDWSKIEKNTLLSSLFFPSFSNYSFSDIHAVTFLNDRRLEQNFSKENKQTLFSYNIQEVLKEFKSNLLPKMFHIKAGAGHLESFADISFSDILLDGAGEKLPVLGQANIFWEDYQWYGRFHFASLHDLSEVFLSSQEREAPYKTSFMASIEGRKNNITPLAFFQKKQDSEDNVIERDLLLNLQGKLDKDHIDFHLKGDAEDINFPLGKKTAFSSPHLHHAHLETDSAIEFYNKLISFSHLNLKSDEAVLEGDGRLEDHLVKAHLLLHALDIKKIFHVIKKGEEDKNSAVNLENIDKRNAKAEFNHLMGKVKNILHDWQWDISIKGDNISYENLVYGNIIFASSLAGGGLQNSLSGYWKEKNSDAHYPIEGTMSITPANSDDLRLSLESGGVRGSIFLPFSWVELLFGGEGEASGLAQFVGAVSAEGYDWESIKNSLDGHIGFVVVNGVIEKSLLMPFIGSAASLLKIGEETENIRCFVGESQIEEGKMRIKNIVLQTGRFSLMGYGEVSLNEKGLNMVFMPYMDNVGSNFVAPFRVEGRFSHPLMTLIEDMKSVNFPKKNKDICLNPLNEVRNGAEGPDVLAEKHTSSVGSILKSLGL